MAEIVGPCPVCNRAELRKRKLFALPVFVESGREVSDSRQDKGFFVPCDRCGDFLITETDALALSAQPQKYDRPKLGILLKEHAIQRMPLPWLQLRESSEYIPVHGHDDFVLSTQVSRCVVVKHDDLIARWPVQTGERMNRALLNLAEASKSLGAGIDVLALGEGLLFALSDDEMFWVGDALHSRGLVTKPIASTSEYSISLTARGWERIEELRRERGNPKRRVFIAMSFAPELTEAYETGIYPAIELAGYRGNRVDSEPHNDWIMNKILGDIRVAPFLVADFTNQKPGVYFEAGFARGLGIPVISMCREDDKENLHFDTKQVNHIFWTDPDDVKKKLCAWIRGTIGEGPYPVKSET